MSTRPLNVLWLALLLGACTGIPEDIAPVQGFEAKRYLGTWYEIARLDHPFERGLSNVTARYSEREDGGLTVVNRGYDKASGEWEEATGKAYFLGASDIGQLKVSFFGPFYGGYNVIELDKDQYRYALLCGANRSYLWILAREPELEPEILERLVARLTELGFPTDDLIYVEHN